MKNNRKGFTLIELLVVIAIIALLSTLAVISLSNAREDARDSKRQADVRTMQSAVELFINQSGVAPDASTSWADLFIATKLGATGLSTPIEDPGTTGYYEYCVDATDASKYLILATTESTTSIDGDLDGTILSYVASGECIREGGNGTQLPTPATACADNASGISGFCVGEL